MTRFLRKVYGILASLFAIIVILAGIGVWHLSSVTVSSQNWTPYIERVLERVVPDSKAAIKSTTLDWDHKEFALSLLCEDLKFRDQRGQTVIAFPKASLKLSMWSLLKGHFLPEEFSADEARFWLMRHNKGVMSLGTMPPNQKDQAKAETDSTSAEDIVDVFAFLQNLGDELAQGNAGHKIQIKNLTVKLYDQRTLSLWELKVPELKVNHEGKKSTGQARVVLKDGSAETSALQLTYLFEQDKRLHNISVSFQDIRLASFAIFAPDLNFLKMVDLPVSGAFSVRTDRNLDIATANIRLDGEKGVIEAPELWDKPRSVERATFRAEYNKNKGKIEVTSAKFDLGGPRIEAELTANVKTTYKHYWFQNRKSKDRYVLTLRMFDLPMNSFDQVWPKTAMPNARSWIIEHMKNGVFDFGVLNVDGRVDYNDLSSLTTDTGGGALKASGGRVTYLDDMPAVDNVNASAKFNLTKMDIKIEQGHTGKILIQPFTIQISGFDKETQNIVIPVALKGPVPDVLHLLDSPPLGYATSMGLKPDETVGVVDGTVTLSLPLLSDVLMEDVGVKARAKIMGFGSDALVPRISLSNGDLRLALSADGMDLNGSIALNGLPAGIVWSTLFDETKAVQSGVPIHKAEIKATVAQNEWSDFYGIGKYLRTEGEVPVTIDYANIKKGHSTVGVKAAFDKADVYVDELAWHKPIKIAARVSFALDLIDGEPIRFNDIQVSGAALNVKGRAELDEATSNLTVVELAPFILGRHDVVSLSYARPVDLSKPYVFSTQGASFDISGLGSSEKGDAAKADGIKTKGVYSKIQPKDFTIKVKKLHTSKDGFLDNVTLQAKRSVKGWEKIKVQGSAQGTVPLNVSLATNKDGGKVLNVNADDFGVALMGAGLGDNVKGGTLSIFAESSPKKPYDLLGKLKVSSFAIKDWPFLARLFSALSPFGFVDLITGEASFDYLRGGFLWDGRGVELDEMRAAGSVLGLNLGGRIDVEENKIAVKGTAVPFSFVNSIIGSIPLIGDVITGGKGQGVIAASFGIKGELSDPDISVNPVSLLTPGFLRNIFFPSDVEGGKPIPKDAYPKKTKE